MQDESERKGTMTVVPIKERLRRCRLRGLTMCSGMLAQFGGMVLKLERKTKGLHLGLFLKHAKEEEKRGHHWAVLLQLKPMFFDKW